MGPSVERRPAAAEPSAEERPEVEEEQPAEKDPTENFGEVDFVPDWGDEDM